MVENKDQCAINVGVIGKTHYQAHWDPNDIYYNVSSSLNSVFILCQLISTRSFRQLGRDIDDFDDRMYDIDQRLSRVVGVRRAT